METGEYIWQCRVRITVALAGFVALWFGINTYEKQEIIVVLLLLAVSTVTILLLVALLILLHEGARRIAKWTKTLLLPVASLNRAMRPHLENGTALTAPKSDREGSV
jgi:hypothetical protein